MFLPFLCDVSLRVSPPSDHLSLSLSLSLSPYPPHSLSTYQIALILLSSSVGASLSRSSRTNLIWFFSPSSCSFVNPPHVLYL